MAERRLGGRAGSWSSADAGGGPELTIGELVIDVLDRHVARRGEEIHLTRSSSICCASWPSTTGGWSPIASCCTRCGGRSTARKPHYLRVHVAHIRAKLEEDPSRPQYLITEPGVGYRLREPEV